MECAYEQEFLNTITEITDNICNVNPQDQDKVIEWLENLQKRTAEEELVTRNQYALFLLRSVDNGKLDSPFSESPPCGRLPSLCQTFWSRECSDNSVTLGSDIDPDVSGWGEEDVCEGREEERPGRVSLGPFDEELEAWEEEGDVEIEDIPRRSPPREEVLARLSAAAAAPGSSAALHDFLLKAAPHTSDRGLTLFDVVSYEVEEFRDFVRNVYETIKEDASSALAEEQHRVQRRYEFLERRTLAEALALLNGLRAELPGFDYTSYEKDPDYIKKLLEACPNETQAVEEIEKWEKKCTERRLWIKEETQRYRESIDKKLVQLKELEERYETLRARSCSYENAVGEAYRSLEYDASYLRQIVEDNEKKITKLLGSTEEEWDHFSPC